MSAANSALDPALDHSRTAPSSGARRTERFLRLAAAGCASLFIVFGPAAGQVFGWHTLFLREWIMFSGSGVGVLKGTFILERPDGTVLRMTPLGLLGLKHYPSAPPDEFGRLVLEDGDLRTFASGICDAGAGVARLSFIGSVGTRQGWRKLDVENVCALPRPASDPEKPRGLGP